MYQILYDGATIYDPRRDELAVREPQARIAVSEAGSLSFIIDPTHPAYDRIGLMSGILELLGDGLTLWRGRITRTPRDFYNAITVEAEGLLACLNDGAIPPHSYPADWADDADYLAAETSGNVVRFYLSWVLDTYNDQVEPWQQIHLGSVTVTDPNNYLYRSCESWATAWETVKGKLLDSLGGYLLVRYESDGTYVDYVDELPLTNTQTVQFGQNLLDLTDEPDATDVYSCILPVGADGLTIHALTDGALGDDLVKDGYIIYSRSARARYGAITRIVNWDDVTEAENLLSKASRELAQVGVKLTETITATAVDLHLTSDEVQALRVGRNTQVLSAPHNLSVTWPLTALDIPLQHPEQTQITLGASVLSLSERNRQAQAEISHQLDLQLGEIREARGRTEQYYQETLEQITSATQSSQAIILEALEEYARTSDLESLRQTLETQLAVQADGVTIRVAELVQQIEDVGGDLQAQISVLQQVFRFAADGFYIGDPNSDIQLKQTNDRVSFISSGLEIAYWANKEFHSETIVADKDLRLPPWVWSVRTDTAGGRHLSLKAGV